MQLLAVDPGPPPVVAVRPLVPPDVVANHRVHHRVPVSQPPITVAGREDGRAIGRQGWVIDLSGGGARLSAPLSVEVGAPLWLRLHVPGEAQATAVQAHVVWHQPLRKRSQLGVQFVDLPEAVRDRIVRAVFRGEIVSRQHRS